MVIHYMILCRSLTRAQRTLGVLERAGIMGRLSRAPKAVESDGCAYCVRVSEGDLARALTILKQAGLPPKRVFMAGEDGVSREVPL